MLSTLTPPGYPVLLRALAFPVVQRDTGGMDVKIKRVYDTADPSDGFRVLVDRLWPRGIAKDAAHIDLWEKEVAPSPELRRSWHAEANGHSPERFQAFTDDYRRELARGEANAALDRLVELARQHSTLTLLYGAKDERVNNAVVLRDALVERIGA